MPADCQPETHAPRKLRVETLSRPRVRHARRRERAPLEAYLGAGRSSPKHPPRDARAGEAARRLQPDAAEQLEALHGERQGQLSREPAAHVLHDVPAQPPVAEGRAGRQRERRPTTSAIRWRPMSPARNTSRPACARRRTGSRLEAPELLAVGRRVRRRHRPADPVRVPGLRAAADPQQPCGAPHRAAGLGPDRAGVDRCSASRTTTP